MGLHLVWSSNSYKAFNLKFVQQSNEYFIWEIFQLACINCENGKKEQACTLHILNCTTEGKLSTNGTTYVEVCIVEQRFCTFVCTFDCTHAFGTNTLCKNMHFADVLAQLENKWQKWCWGMLAGRLGCVPLRGCGMTKRQMLSVTEAPINTPAIWHPCSR